jgi:hypothetical protein
MLVFEQRYKLLVLEIDAPRGKKTFNKPMSCYVNLSSCLTYAVLETLLSFTGVSKNVCATKIVFLMSKGDSGIVEPKGNWSPCTYGLIYTIVSSFSISLNLIICPSLEVNSKGKGRKYAAASDKLLPLPQPPVRACTDSRTNPSAQRATQLRRVLARVYAVSIQNQITTTVP